MPRVQTRLLPWETHAAERERTVLWENGLRELVEAPPTPGVRHWFGVRYDGTLRGGFPVALSRSRTVPGSTLVRVEHLGGAALDALGECAAPALVALGTCTRFVLRVNVALYESRPEHRTALAQVLTAAGYAPVPPRMYVETIMVPIVPDDEQQMSACSSSTRRNIRESIRAGIVVRPLASLAYAPTLDRLSADAFLRHGGERPRPNGATLLANQGSHSVVLGAFHGSAATPENLVGFAVFTRTGHTALYDVAGTARRLELGRTPISHPLLWEGFRWARSQGCTSMDLGGVPPVDAVNDPRASIAAFKAGFGGHRLTVGGEWQCSPSRVLSVVEGTVKRVLRRR